MVRYDLLFLFAYALAFFGAYLLARELGLSPAGAAIAGPRSPSRPTGSSRTATCR